MTVFTLLILTGICSTSAIAQGTTNTKSWEFNLAPFYLWGFSIDGDLTLGTNTAPLDIPFNDIAAQGLALIDWQPFNGSITN